MTRRNCQDPSGEIREENEPPIMAFLPESRPETVTFVRHVHPPPKNGREFRSPDGSETCSICLNSISAPVTVSPCYHLFCMRCIVKWLKTKTKCPNCRGRVSSVLHKDNQDSYMEINLSGANSNSVLKIDENGALRVVPAELEFSADDSEDFMEVGEFYPIVQPIRTQIYLGNYVREPVQTCNLPYDVGDIDRIEQWITRDVQTICNMLDSDGADDIIDDLMEKLVSYSKKDVIFLSKYKSDGFRATCDRHFGEITEIFIDELLNFALSGQSMENYDRTTYYSRVSEF